MREFGMGEAGLLSLNGDLRLVQRTPGGAMRGPFRLQRGFQFCDARFERRCWIVVAPAVEDNHRDAAILHKSMAGARLVGSLLRGLPSWTLQTQGAAHSVFGCLRVTW